MATTDELDGTVWTVPVINLPAPMLVNVGDLDPVIPLPDQTVWIFDSAVDGTIVGRSATNVGGGWSERLILGTVDDDGDVLFAFAGEDGATVDPGSGVSVQPLTIGRGHLATLGGETTFLMQMTSGNGLGSLTHWAYMVETGPTDLAYGQLPGYRTTSVPDLYPDAAPVEPVSGPQPPRPDPADIAVWDGLEGRYFIVPPANLPATLLLEGGTTAADIVTLPVADQTAWHIETVADGYVVGRVMANLGGGWSEQILVGSITPDGSVSFSFTPEQGATVGPGGIHVQSIIVGNGTMVTLDGETAFLMQMTTGTGTGSISHWAYMVEATPDDAAYAALPGYTETGIPDLFPDAAPAVDGADGEIAAPDPAAIAALRDLAGTTWLLPRDGNDLTVLRNGPAGAVTETVDISLALRIETVRDGYLLGTMMLTTGTGWTSYGITGSVTTAGTLLLTAIGADAAHAGIVGEVRDTAAGPVLELQYAGGNSALLAAADVTLLPGGPASPVDDPSGAIGATLGYLFDGADGSFALTAGDDVFAGLANAERVEGRDGDDRMDGGGGGDTLIGGGGDDTLSGRGGADRLRGEDGDDLLFGGSGEDVLAGGDGDDRVAGLGGDDRLFGGRGDDVLRGGDGGDTLVGSLGRDTLVGGGGDDSLFGGRDGDILVAGEGADTLEGGAENDRIVLGAPDGAVDVVLLADRRHGIGFDTVSGFEDGVDRIDVSALAAVDGFADLSLAATAAGVVIGTGGGEGVLLLGLALADVTDADFMF